jgi:choline monooxygenase
MVIHALMQDGGYHVSVAHPELAAGLDLGSYRSELFERLSIQSCQPAAPLGSTTDAGDNEAGEDGGNRQEAARQQPEQQQEQRREQRRQRQQRIAGGRAPAYIFFYPNLMLNRHGLPRLYPKL